MPRETKAERQLRETAEQEQAARSRAEFQATLPLRFLKLIAQANARDDVDSGVYDHPEGGLRIEFKFPAPQDAGYSPERQIIRLTSETWEVEAIENEFKRLEAEDTERARIRQVALDAWEKLSPEERTALGLRKP